MPGWASTGWNFKLNHYQPITSFGSGKGYVSPQLNASIGTSSLVQPDGKLLVFGTLNDANEDAVAVRLNTDGSLDTTFGSDGYHNLGTDINSGQSLEPDGQIVLPGTNLSRPSADFNPVRLLANGSPDPSFGIDGTATGRASLTTGDAVAELPDGQTLVAGEAGSLGGILIERFNANGSPDSTFAPGQGFAGQNGYIYVGPEALPSNSSTNVDAMTVDSSGRIYLDEAGVGILRFDTNGQLDKTFGTHGIYENANADGMLVEASDQILISTGTNTLVRLNANGQIDNTFGSSGTAALPTAFSQNAAVFAVQSDGKILVGGSTNVTAFGNSTDMAVVRLNSSGSIDASFGTAGMAIADKLPEEDVAGAPAGYSASSSALAVLSGGTIVLAGAGGQSFHAGNAVGPTIAEFLPTGQLNSAFGTDGQTSAFVPAGESTATGQSLIVQNDGTLVVAGTSYAGGEPYMSSSFLIVRYAADGTVDSDLVNNFAPTDPNSQGFGPFTSFSQAVAGPNGTIVAVGSLMPDPFTGPVGQVLADYITEANTLTGTVIGTPDSYENKGNTIATAFDGNLTNFFDAPTASGNYVGLDLGAAKVITQISYAPRPGFAYRMDGGIFQASNSATFTSGDVTLFTITHAPPTGVLTTVAISNPNAYRFIRYVGPANSYCNIAEMQLTGTSSPAVIGTSGSYENHGNTIANVFDGNLNTFFDAPAASGAWVGLDLGSPQAITEVSFAPRPGWDSRMVGGEIQASNSANFSSGVVTAYTITAAPPAGVLTTATFASVGAYQYWRYMGPANGYCNIAELVFDVG